MTRKTNVNTQLVSSGRKKAYTHGVVNPVVQRASTVVFDSVEELQNAAKKRGDKTLFYGRRGTTTHFALQENIEVFKWFKIYFIENDGMAWGTKISDFVSFISDRTAKTILTLFRIVAIFGIGYWLYDVTKKQSPKVLILAIALIFAGALGNIIDSVFYGVLFDDSYSQVANFLPETSTMHQTPRPLRAFQA